LICALEDEEALVREHVAWALGQIGTAEAVEGLQKRRLVEADASVRYEIEAALELSGSSSPELSMKSCRCGSDEC
jgi:HEAT repeat protein